MLNSAYFSALVVIYLLIQSGQAHIHVSVSVPTELSARIPGRAAAKKYIESIKAVGKDGHRQTLIKWIEGKCKAIGLEIVRHKIKVWWPAAGKYYFGTVASFDDIDMTHHVDYDDKTAEDLWLPVESWEDLGETLSSSHELQL